MWCGAVWCSYKKSVYTEEAGLQTAVIWAKYQDHDPNQPDSTVFCEVKLLILPMEFGWFGESNIWFV